MKSEDFQKQDVLAIIPARGGSKGIPRKNIQELCGKPLIAYSVEAALKAKWVNRVVVSTEDEEIAEISRCFGAEVPFLRPVHMAQDHSNVGDAIYFTLTRLKIMDYIPDIYIILYPTNPFRNPRLIDYLTHKIVSGFSPVLTAKQLSHSQFTLFHRTSGNDLKPLLDLTPSNGLMEERKFYRLYGLFQGKTHDFYGRPYLHVIRDPISYTDIDRMSDFYFAEEIIKQGLFDFDLSYQT